MSSQKVNHSWRDLNYKKRKMKGLKTIQKLKKQAKAESVANSSNEVDSNEYTPPTISIALPGSILDNAQSSELRTYLAGQVARAATIYNIDEIVIFDDHTQENDVQISGFKRNSKSCEQLSTILQYLDCPQYLRKHIFPLHNHLKYAGVLNPLDAPHHLRKDSTFQYREGVVLTIPPKNDQHSYVDVGLNKPVAIDMVLDPYCRVTVKLDEDVYKSGGKMRGKVVSPSQPKRDTGKYWGYTVRIAKSLNEIFTQCPYQNGYDLTIGTSDKGVAIDDVTIKSGYEHALVTFGGLRGLEIALEGDDTLKVDDVSLLFDYYVNVCPRQGSAIIRTEEAILITLAELRKSVFERSVERNEN